MDELLNQFSQRAPRSKRIALQVINYILPANQAPETEQNSRVVGVDAKTGQVVEIALRPFEGERPTLAQFYNDSASSTPVTTLPGGSLIVEGAYPNDQLSSLSTQGYPVYSARWLVRAAQDENHGRAGVYTARVNEPRVSPNNPTRGPYQTVTVLNDDAPVDITSIKQLDEQLLNALDPALHTRQAVPGSLGAIVRLEAPNGNSEIVEMYGGFYLPKDAQHRVPKTRPMVAEDLANNTNWQRRRDLIKQAAQAGYSVSLLETRTVMVGPKAMKGKNIQAVKNDANEPLFSSYVLALRYREDGSAFLTAAKPEGFEHVPSRTGLPSPDERAQSQISESREQDATENAPAAQAKPETVAPAPTQPATAAPAAAQPAPVQSTPANEPAPTAMIRRNPEGGMQVIGHSPEQAQALSQIAQKVGGRFDQKNNVLNISADALPPTMQRLKNANIQYEVDQSTPAAPEKPAQSAPQVQPQSSAPNVQQHHQSTQHAPNEPAPEAHNIDLASLDLSNIDLDRTLAEAYNNQSPKGPQR